MNRYDWILAGMCLYGIHLIVQGVLAALAVAANPSLAQVEMFGLSEIRTAGLLQATVTSFVGTCLVLFSLKLGLANDRGRASRPAVSSADAG